MANVIDKTNRTNLQVAQEAYKNPYSLAATRPQPKAPEARPVSNNERTRDHDGINTFARTVDKE